MLSFLLPLFVHVLGLSSVSAVPAASAPPAPRLELTARAHDARALAAEVIIDADAIVDVVALDGGAVIDLDLAGERHELRLQTDAHGRVVGAALWWIGPAVGLDAWNTDAAIGALMLAGSLDALTIAGGVVTIEADGQRIAIEPLDDVEPALDDVG